MLDKQLVLNLIVLTWVYIFGSVFWEFVKLIRNLRKIANNHAEDC